jgi:tRNA-dihydrouridine synthase B
MKNPELAGKIVRAVVDAINIPVTVKIRSGWDDTSKNAVELSKILEANGASAICVHARTKEDLYRPGIDIDIISKVKKSVSIPVIGNGDIYNASDAINMLNATGCDGIMIGRGAMGNPWIFSEIVCALENRAYKSPTNEQKIALAIEQLSQMIEHKGERIGLAEGKKHVGWYLTGMNGAASARNRIMTSSSFSEIKAILQEMLV